MGGSSAGGPPTSCAPPADRGGEAPPSPSPSSPPSSSGGFGAAAKFFGFIYGASGQGKTLYARGSYRARIAAGGRGVFVDPNARNGDLGRVVRSVAELRAAVASSGSSWSLVYQPGWGEKEAELWPLLYRIGHVLVAVDEAQTYAASGAGALDADFLQLVQKGRNNCVDILTTCQGPNELHPRVRQNWDAVISFRQGIPQYAETLERMYFRRPGLAAVLLELPRFHYLRVDQRGEVSRGVVRIA